MSFEPGGHVEYVCTIEHEDGGVSCMFCEGGLGACIVCDAFEGAWPDECPGEKMTYEQIDEVYAGQLNYRDGAWREGECCQVMRHMHDTENYMREHGYRPGDQSKGERQWVES